jgi:hypothetical protein
LTGIKCLPTFLAHYMTGRDVFEAFAKIGAGQSSSAKMPQLSGLCQHLSELFDRKPAGNHQIQPIDSRYHVDCRHAKHQHQARCMPIVNSSNLHRI